MLEVTAASGGPGTVCESEGSHGTALGRRGPRSSLADALPGRVVTLDEINEERGLYGGKGNPLSGWARTNELARPRVIARPRDDHRAPWRR
jgi:hypothetical protein